MVYSEVLDIFANLAVQVGVSYEQFMLNFKNTQLSDYAVRGSWKYGCDHHVSGTPTFYINGVESPASSEWTFDDWTVRNTHDGGRQCFGGVCAHLCTRVSDVAGCVRVRAEIPGHLLHSRRLLPRQHVLLRPWHGHHLLLQVVRDVRLQRRLPLLNGKPERVFGHSLASRPPSEPRNLHLKTHGRSHLCALACFVRVNHALLSNTAVI